MTDLTAQSNSSARLDRIETVLSSLMIDFVRPLLQQSLANTEEIATLVATTDRIASAVEQHQDWLDDDRRELAEHIQTSNQQIQALIEQGNADRKASDDRFAQQLSESRQNQRLLLSGREKTETLLAEVLSLSRRVATIEDAA